MKLYSNPYTYKSAEARFEPENLEPSQTIPDQDYSVADLLDMHIRGIKPAIENTPIYEDDIFGEEMNPMRKQDFDLSDIDEIKDDLAKGESIVSLANKNKQKQAKKAEKTKIIEEYERQKSKSAEKTDGNPEKAPDGAK